MNWEEKRITCLIAGDSGSGKTFLLCNIPKALIYDTDLGGGAAYLADRIARNGSERVECGSFQDLLRDLEARHKAGTLEKFTSLVIDHVTALHQESQLRWNPAFKDDFGRSGNKATGEWRKIREFCRDFDFNLFASCHTKQKYEGEVSVGEVADGAKNLAADFGVVLFLKNIQGKYPSTAVVKKWRRDPEDARGAIPATIPGTYQEICRIAGIKCEAPRAVKDGASVPTIEAPTLAQTINIAVREKAAPDEKAPVHGLSLRDVQECLAEFAVATKAGVQEMKDAFLVPYGYDRSSLVMPEHFRVILGKLLMEYDKRGVASGLHPKLNARIQELSREKKG